MASTIREFMTPDPITVSCDDTVVDAARKMRDADVGPVLVMDGDTVRGILTDRDIVVRGLADGQDVSTLKVSAVATLDVECLSPDDDTNRAIELMRTKAIRRIPILEDGRPVGIVSIGDLAIDLDSHSALADISAA